MKKKLIFPEASFNELQFENIFLRDAYPDATSLKHGKSKSKVKSSTEDKAELWALYDAPVKYDFLSMLRALRGRWGIHLDLEIGARSVSNPAARGSVAISHGKRPPKTIFFEEYAGNISDATRSVITMAPYDQNTASRALSQKIFVRFVVPLKALNPLDKIAQLLLAYDVAQVLDAKRFAGIVDPDMYLFVPPNSVVAGIRNFLSPNQMLNTHLITGFNFYQNSGAAFFFTHGHTRFAMPDLLIASSPKNPLTTGDYAGALKTAHSTLLSLLTKKPKLKLTATKQLKLPEQVRAMLAPKILEIRIKPGEK